MMQSNTKNFALLIALWLVSCNLLLSPLTIGDFEPSVVIEELISSGDVVLAGRYWVESLSLTLSFSANFENLNSEYATTDINSITNSARKKSLTGKSNSLYCGWMLYSIVQLVSEELVVVLTHVYSPEPCMKAIAVGIRPLIPSPM